MATTTNNKNNNRKSFSSGHFETVPNSEADAGANTVILSELRHNVCEVKEQFSKCCACSILSSLMKLQFVS